MIGFVIIGFNLTFNNMNTNQLIIFIYESISNKIFRWAPSLKLGPIIKTDLCIEEKLI